MTNPDGFDEGGRGSAKDAPVEATAAAERYVRVGARPENLGFTFDGAGA